MSRHGDDPRNWQSLLDRSAVWGAEVCQADSLRRADVKHTPKIVVMGHSFGAVLALEYAAKYPTATSHVIIVAGLWDTEVQCRLRLARFGQLRPDVYGRARNATR